MVHRAPHRLHHLAAALCVVFATASTSFAASPDPEVELFRAAPLAPPPSHLVEERWRPVGVNAFDGASLLRLELFDGERIRVQHRRSVENPSGSTSWIGEVVSTERRGGGPVVLVHRDGITLGSIRVGADVYMLSHGPADGHVLYRVDESLPKYRELEPTAAPVDPQLIEDARRRATRARATGSFGGVSVDDGSVQDVLVVYTVRARDAVGGQVAIENLIDLGVTETNMSYETSGIHHRLRLVGTLLTPEYDEMSGIGCPRDLIQDPNDGVMDEVHGVRDQLAADLVKLIFDGSGCGRAFIMNEISTAHAAFAFGITNHVCVSPGYTFQHELGHIQAGRHQRTAPQPDSPFTFNFGFTDPDNRFRTIMAAGSAECPDGCPRRLAWSNPDVLDGEAGTPMGIPEGEELPADNRKTLNATAWVVANFRVSGAVVFADGFESGDVSAWSALVVSD